MLRDTALAASGLLVEKIGGPSVKPYQPAGIWDGSHDASNTRKYVQDHGDALYRRSLYTFWKRMATMPDMDTFDSPMRDAACTRRQRTDTPLQALVSMNEPLRLEASRKLAERLIHESSNVDARLDYLGRILLCARLEFQGKDGAGKCAHEIPVDLLQGSISRRSVAESGREQSGQIDSGDRTGGVDAGFQRGPESGCGDEQMNSQKPQIRTFVLRPRRRGTVGLRLADPAVLA